MTFATLPAWQAWLLIVASAALAAWVFRLKVRPPRRRAPSLIMWSRVFLNARELSWWERVRRVVSLVITVLIALALAAALTRPSARASADAIVIVIDSSWSMAAASPDGGTRWERAVSEAQSLARSAGGSVTLATTATGIVEGPTPDVTLIERALARIEPGGDSHQWPQPVQGETVHFVTDGGVARSLEKSVIVHSVHRPAPNVAITAFDARPAISMDSGARAYVEFANFAASAQRVRLTVTRDASPVVDREIEMAAGELVRQSINLAATGGPRLRAHVSAAANALAIDDEASAWLGESDALTVAVVSNAPSNITSVLARDPSLRVRATSPARYRPDDADLVIFDEWLPESPPGRPMLVIRPPKAAWLSGSPGSAPGESPTGVSVHPVVAGVDPLLLGLSRVERSPVSGLTVAATTDDEPLVAFEDRPDRRLVLLAFRVDDAVRASPAFAVLLGNAVDWLARPPTGPPRPTGPIELPSSTSRVTSPDGQPVPLVRVADRVLARVARPGLYLAHAGGARRVIAVNAGGADVSNLMRTTASDAGTRAEQPVYARAWWMYGVILALILVTAEWWTWQRRITV